ncbi:MAG: RNA-binding protein [Candidatus Margulisiibacteriota bacterium]|nr:MAG: RNA-binding protein [Candidatus Margulisbacteria bacterium GWD2_39_127]OGI05571.1 MAG: RNA-binding protein [Candidatus Margulisbacteria bacterium GWF2_38_17]OGI09499.1 MAG: RNA-binding protein [Candidatus Margulisbacteria bacterium GWE2_39_32]PZM77024.1 MAG: RNA-binding protein [Candidatus Margulisiibacteriota bacterium]HAR62103.1 RNA-binding protein [Candidatus Margulisiibacteriota bacterium]
MNIYVGNLSYDTTEEELKELFEEFGSVKSTTVIKDKFSGKSKGFGFVEMAEKADADSAINNLNGKEIKSRTLRVNEAQPRPAMSRSGGGDRRGDSRGGNGGNRGRDSRGGGFGGGRDRY